MNIWYCLFTTRFDEVMRTEILYKNGRGEILTLTKLSDNDSLGWPQVEFIHENIICSIVLVST